MRPEIQISRNTLTADLFLSLYSAVGWEAPCRAQVERAFAVLPACQGQGVGRALLHAAQEAILSGIPQGWAVSLELISTPTAVDFYRRQGFEERPCAWDGPGMFKMLRRA